jgi:glyoxylase-like metal-dependent hydrolase (beta-lactamase superfamily II)
MRTKGLLCLVVFISLLSIQSALAQDFGPKFKKVKEGIYVYTDALNESNCTIILTEEGVVLIDSGQSPKDSHVVAAAIKKLTAQPVRFIIHTEPHSDHVLGDFLFSPPAVVIAHAGATASMKQAGLDTPSFVAKRTAESAELRSAFEGYRMVAPQVEYRDKMTLNLGERTFELTYLKNVHSDADSAIWLPKERIVFAAASVTVKRFGNLRPNVSIPEILSALKMMKALNPEIVIPGHGDPGTVKILDDMETYYNLLMERVGQMAKQGKSLDEIKKELKIEGTDNWAGKERFPNNIEAAYRAVTGKQ